MPGRVLLAAARPDPRADGAGRGPAGHRHVGRADRRAGRRVPLGPGVREPRRGDGRLEPASRTARSGPGPRCRTTARARTRRSGPTSRRPGAGCCSTTSTTSRAASGSIVETDDVAGGRAVLGGLAVRDAGRAEAAGGAADRAGRCGPRRPGRRPARADRPLRRAVQAAVPVFDGLAPGAVRRRRRPTTGRSTPISTRRSCGPTSASSWSATSCWPRPSAT